MDLLEMCVNSEQVLYLNKTFARAFEDEVSCQVERDFERFQRAPVARPSVESDILGKCCTKAGECVELCKEILAEESARNRLRGSIVKSSEDRISGMLDVGGRDAEVEMLRQKVQELEAKMKR
mmetsp:Transcript_4391/g.6539  ORF Transcript_4391/g.6539 Transcript_4391/m.6539 type:complete len:123 (-) Transcript_4391:8-376(-)